MTYPLTTLYNRQITPPEYYANIFFKGNNEAKIESIA
jgi:hypothetical protein